MPVKYKYVPHTMKKKEKEVILKNKISFERSMFTIRKKKKINELKIDDELIVKHWLIGFIFINLVNFLWAMYAWYLFINFSNLLACYLKYAIRARGVYKLNIFLRAVKL